MPWPGHYVSCIENEGTQYVKEKNWGRGSEKKKKEEKTSIRTILEQLMHTVLTGFN